MIPPNVHSVDRLPLKGVHDVKMSGIVEGKNGKMVYSILRKGVEASSHKIGKQSPIVFT